VPHCHLWDKQSRIQQSFSLIYRASLDMFNLSRRSDGFTLIELMIATTIVAILAAIALPAYQGQTRKSNRAAAQAFLMDIGTRQQQRFLDVRSYADTTEDLGITTPEKVATHYTVVITPDEGPPAGYRIEATPKGKQTKDTACNPLVLDQAGVRSPADCW
jgi:type IV pilus assembly protein PilE